MTPKEYINREKEIAEARAAYPGIEIGDAYRKWKAERGEEATGLQTGDPSLEMTKKLLKEAATKPCTREGCKGTMTLEPICGGCVEGKAGFRSKWTCSICLYRELLKEGYDDVLRKILKEAKSGSVVFD